jgi:hypothetical protein
MKQYILFLHENPETFAEVSPAEMEAIVGKYIAWRAQHAARIVEGHKLQDGSGRVIRAGAITDGPYTEAKEVLGGIFLITATGYDDAVALARTCPHCEFGAVEVRQIDQV